MRRADLNLKADRNNYCFKRLPVLQGPICTLFSKIGKRAGTSSPMFRTHTCYYETMSKSHDIMLIENVPEYPTDVARRFLPSSWEVLSTVVDPRLFGIPTARARRYMIAFNKTHVRLRNDVCSGCTHLECDCYSVTHDITVV